MAKRDLINKVIISKDDYWRLIADSKKLIEIYSNFMAYVIELTELRAAASTYLANSSVTNRGKLRKLLE